jgi:hypothetical protein
MRYLQGNLFLVAVNMEGHKWPNQWVIVYVPALVTPIVFGQKLLF